MATWHIPPASQQMVNEINYLWPHRSKKSDGTIGDAAHAARVSHHNPDADDRSVNARDITHHPGVFDAHGFARWLVSIDDPRVIEVISDRQIWTRTRAREGWRPYAGASPHTAHAHVSFSHDPALEDSWASYGVERFFDQQIGRLPNIVTPTTSQEAPTMTVIETYLIVTEPPSRPGDFPEQAILADNGISLTHLNPEDWDLVRFFHALAGKEVSTQQINQAVARHMQRRRLDPVALRQLAGDIAAELARPAIGGIDASALATAVAAELSRRLAA